MRSKRCSCCIAYKAESEFNRDSRKRDGLKSCCKTCHQAKHRAYRLANLHDVRARGRVASSKWREANHEKALAIERRWRERQAKARRNRERKDRRMRSEQRPI